jgi:hypothetical protein
MFAHSAESWTSMWDSEVFEKEAVEVDTQFKEISEEFSDDP